MKNKTKQTIGLACSTALVLMLLGGCTVLEPPKPGPAPSSSASEESAPEPLPAVQGEGKVELAAEVFLTQEQQNLLTNYMDYYYDSLAYLELRDPSLLFTEEDGTQALGNRAVWEYLIGLRSMQRMNLSLNAYRYRLVCRKVEEREDGGLLLFVTEDSVQNFAAYPEVDAQCVVIYHEFILSETEDGWRIFSHMQMDSLYFNLFGGGQNSAAQAIYEHPWFEAEEPQAYFSARLEELLGEAEENVARRGTETAVERTAKPNYGYARRTACVYAKKWVGYRNADWPDYGWFGGNCQNFVSQCLLAGGIPMDTSGPDVWKWYDDDPSNAESEEGRSASWSGVVPFREYVGANTGYGLTGRIDMPYYSGRQGDILVLGETEDWRHSVLITDVLAGESGETVDYLISSNTADLRDFPASAYFYTCQSLIMVDGWNGLE